MRSKIAPNASIGHLYVIQNCVKSVIGHLGAMDNRVETQDRLGGLGTKKEDIKIVDNNRMQ